MKSTDAGGRPGRDFAPERAQESSGRTNIFIHRGFDWQVVDLLMTNFHLPKTTLLMMIDAFVGDRWRRLSRCRHCNPDRSKFCRRHCPWTANCPDPRLSDG